MAEPLSVNQTCAMLESVRYPSLSAVSGLLRKAAMLKEFSNMIMKAGDVAGIPDLTNLVPVSQIDEGVYDQLRTSCVNPATNDPLFPSLEDNPSGVTDLKGYVLEGYQQISNGLQDHPYGVMSVLNSHIDDLLAQAQSQTSALVGAGTNIFGCMSSLCSGAKGVTQIPGKFTEEGERLNDAFDDLKGDPGILDANEKQKTEIWKNATERIKILMQNPFEV
jgi:hypothetical protein